jgi:hypothetical protein
MCVDYISILDSTFVGENCAADVVVSKKGSPATYLTHSQQLVDTFHTQHPSAPRRLPASVFATLPWRPRQNFTTTPPCPNWEFGLLAAADVAHKEGVM